MTRPTIPAWGDPIIQRQQWTVLWVRVNLPLVRGRSHEAKRAREGSEPIRESPRAVHLGAMTPNPCLMRAQYTV
jgi:hypothetical protein